MRLVDGDTDAAVEASEEEATSASCSWRRSWSWVSAKAGILMGVSGAMVAGEERDLLICCRYGNSFQVEYVHLVDGQTWAWMVARLRHPGVRSCEAFGDKKVGSWSYELRPPHAATYPEQPG